MAEPRLSFIVPVLNEAQALPSFLEQLQPWREVAEIIIVDGGSEDGSDKLAEPLCDRLVVSARGRAPQMNAGAQQATGAYLFFLHCDTQLGIRPEGLQHVLREQPAWGYFRVRLSGSDWRLRIIEAAMNLRSRLTRIATGDQCLFIGRELWWELGGFADIPLMEDVELCKRLRKCARPLLVTPAVITSSRRWEQRGIVLTVLKMWLLRLAYQCGARPAQLARFYHG